MASKRQWIWIGLLSALALLAAACGAATEGNGGEAAGAIPESISCEVYYRASAGQALDGSSLTLSTDGDSQALDFDDLRFEANFLYDLGEGRSLSIAVTDLTVGAELTRALYQLDPVKGLVDQFIGGHGFTGLNYVFNPTSGGEIQYFCLAGS